MLLLRVVVTYTDLRTITKGPAPMFALPLAVFTAFMVWLLVEVIRGSITDTVPLRAGMTWAITCPVAGFLFGIGLAPFALVCGVVSMLALGSLGFWFLAAEESGGEDDPPVEPVAPDPSPSDGIDPESDPLLDSDALQHAHSGWGTKVLTGDSHHYELPA
jgi:hypothetical protein